ncbi:unnamed protein product [Sympodiomycopsis kandeliae]
MLSTTKTSGLLLALMAAPALAGQVDSHGNLIRRTSSHHQLAARGKKDGGSKSSSAKSAHYTTIDGKQYPKDLSADAPAPVITSNWWLDEVQKNDTTKHSFKYSNLPKTSEDGQKGTNICKKGQTDNSMCQTALLNSAEDFCLWGPPEPNTAIADSEEYEIAWCTQDHGARLIPSGTLTSVHFVKTDSYVQVTGTGDFTKINIKEGDMGGELDPHGATGNGNPVGGLVYTTAFSEDGKKKKHTQINEWMQEISSTQFCFRGCKGTDVHAQTLCSHIYDEMGCAWLMPANYQPDIFENCEGEDAVAPGIIGTYTFTQGDPVTPSARSAPSSSNCQTVSSITGPQGVVATSASSSGSGSGSGGVHTLAQKALATGGASSNSYTSGGSSSSSSTSSASETRMIGSALFFASGALALGAIAFL